MKNEENLPNYSIVIFLNQYTDGNGRDSVM